jgi:hypothetical protein
MFSQDGKVIIEEALFNDTSSLLAIIIWHFVMKRPCAQMNIIR